MEYRGSFAGARAGRLRARLLRRLVMRGLGPRQFGLAPDGIGAHHKHLQAAAACPPRTVVARVDIADSF